MDIVTLPNPVPGKGEVLVRTHFSAISAGTEGKTVSDARKGYIAKARSRQEEVAKVIKTAQSIGVVETYKMVMNKLEALQPLGYSTAGVVVQVGEGVSAFRPGDRVACGGASASHSELTVVKENLVVKLPDTAPMDESAFTTIGAIALQGIRRADLKIGENCVVVGLGLIGQMTIRILKAAGVRVFGVDLRQELIDLAFQSGADGAALRSDEMLDGLVKTFSNGYGTDAVIITAGTASNDPVELAGTLCRHHGKVVIVGNVPTGFSRKTYYRKELELLMSTSYGPGRYDANYEEKGLDYPIGQVRWTENRNMQAFVELLGAGKLSLKDLISHRFNFQDAKKAFDAILDSAVHTMGVLLEYDHERPLQTPEFPKQAKVRSGSVSFIGAGSFAGNFLLPHLSRLLPLESVLTSRPHTAEDARQKYSFVRACSELDSFLSDTSAAVAITTRHDTHALFAIRSLKAGKRVFVEKPLCLNMAEYKEIESLLQTPGTPDLMVGFNRRFAPLTQRLREKFKGLPMAINYRINAGVVPADHWVHDLEIGGGRIIGEACHFVDLCSFLARSPVEFVSAHTLKSSPQNGDTFAATLRFENGSVANISYFSNGNKALAKEHLEVFSGGVSAVMDDFKSLVNYGNKVEKHKLAKQDKGHAAEMDAFTKAVKSGDPFPITVRESLHATKATFAIVESISQGGVLIDVSSF
jgi:polar amino acid transport system substrate-binding protein